MARSLSSLHSVTIALSSVLLFCAIINVKATTSKMSSTTFESFWDHELPGVVMPEALKKLASPLSPSSTRLFLKHLKLAEGNPPSSTKEFCSSAGILCWDQSDITVCIFRVFIYEYGNVACANSASAISQAAASALFFTQPSLMQGEFLTIPDTSNNLSNNKLLPDSLARAMPAFDPKHLSELMSIFGVPKGSDMELEMKNTLAHCSFKFEHEIKACQASGESMLRFVTETVGQDVIVLTLAAALSKQKAKVVNVHQVSKEGDKVITCHDMKFPSIIFSCHMTKTTQVLDVSLQLAGGQVAHALAICHLDTSYWNPTHIAFKILKSTPGNNTVCHWLPENSFVFIPHKVM